MGLGITASASCLARVFGVCFFLLLTIWVTPGNRTREVRTRGPTVLTQDSQGPQMVGLLIRSSEHQISCISRLLHLTSDAGSMFAPLRWSSTCRCKQGSEVTY